MRVISEFQNKNARRRANPHLTLQFQSVQRGLC